MDIRTAGGTLAHLEHIFDSRSYTEGRLETVPDKPPYPGGPVKAPLPEAAPEEKGVPSRALADYFAALDGDRTLDMHAVTVLRDGAVIARCGFGAYDPNVWRASFSEAKSLVGLAVGMLVGEGRLSPDDRAARILEKRLPRLIAPALRAVTVRHLLTMTSGVPFNEAGSAVERDWVRGFFSALPAGKPGERFRYNSMNSYILAAIVCEVTGESLTEYLRPRLLEPLGIEPFFWEKCPMGIEKGGWGVYMRQEDFAKVGQLVLQGGVWNGAQLVDALWLAEATRPQVSVPAAFGAFDYGYHIWAGRDGRSFLFSGMFDQNVLGFFDTDVLVVCNACNAAAFQQSDFFDLTLHHLGVPFGPALPADPAGAGALRRAVASAGYAGAREAEPAETPALPPECAALDGLTYLAASPNAASVGLLPLVTQMFQNLFTRGLVRVSFRVRGREFFLDVQEQDESYTLPVGFAAPAQTELRFHGEPHRVAVTARFARDEDARPVLLMRVSFLETAPARFLRFYFAEDGTARLRLTEAPGRAFAARWVSSLAKEVSGHPLAEGALRRTDEDYVDYKLKAVFEPELTLRQVPAGK